MSQRDEAARAKALKESIARALESAPPLTEEQLDRLAGLLRPDHPAMLLRPIPDRRAAQNE